MSGKPRMNYEHIDPVADIDWDKARIYTCLDTSNDEEGEEELSDKRDLCRAIQLDRNVEFTDEDGAVMRIRKGDYLVMMGVGTSNIKMLHYGADEFDLYFALEDGEDPLAGFDTLPDADDPNLSEDDRRVLASLDKAAAEDPDGIWGPLDDDEDGPGPGFR